MSGKKESKKSFGISLRSIIRSTSHAISPRRGNTTPKHKGSSESSPAPVHMDLSTVTPQQVKSITTFQARVRGFLVRRGMKLSGSQQQRELQIRSLRHFVRTEQKYLEKLDLLIKEYLVPCREICKGNKKKLRKLDWIFIGVEKMHALHVKFCRVIENYWDLWPACQGIGRALTEHLVEFTFYEQYVNNIPFSKTTFKELEKEGSSITTLIMKLDRERKENWDDPAHVYRDFRKLLKLPLKHILDYKSPLKKLMVATPHTHPDYRYRVAVSATFREIGLYLDFIFKRSLANQEMVILEGRLITKSKQFQVQAPGRKIVRQGEMFVNDGNSKRVILFNDVCLIAATMNKVTYSYEDHFELKGAKILRISTSPDGSSHIFSVIPSDGRSFTFKPASFAKCRSWQKSFEDAISKRNDLVFGRSVVEVVEGDHSPVPRIIFSIVYRLNRGLTEDRVFRAAGDSKSLRSLRRRFNHHLRDLDLSTSFSRDVAALLLPYLESLPEPIFILETSDEMLSPKSNPSDEEIFAYFKRRVASLVPAHRNLFEFLVLLLHRASSVSAEENSLSSMELSVLFSPCLFRPKEWNLNYCYRMPRIVKLFSRVLAEPHRVFEMQAEPLPQRLEDFLYADLFGDWWRRLRMNEPKILEFLSSETNLRKLMLALIVEENLEVGERMRRSHGAALACLTLTHDHIKPILLEDEELMIELYTMVREHARRGNNLRFCRDVLEALIESHSEEVAKWMNSHPGLSLVEVLDAGNIAGLFSSVANKSSHYQYNKHHRIIHMWVGRAFGLYTSPKNLNSVLLDFAGAFLEIVFRDDAFLNSAYAEKITCLLNDGDTIDVLLTRTLPTKERAPRDCVPYLQLLQMLLVQRPRAPAEEEEEEDDNDNEEEDKGTDSDSDSDASDASESADSEAGQERPIEVTVEYPFPRVVPSLISGAVSYLPRLLELVEEASSQNSFTLYHNYLLGFVSTLLYTNRMNADCLTPAQLQSIFELVFQFPNNSIMHNVIIRVVSWFARYSEQSATVLSHTRVAQKINEEITVNDSPCPVRGEMFHLAQILFRSPHADILTSKMSAQASSLVADYAERNKPHEVKRRNRNLVTDRYEDRI